MKRLTIKDNQIVNREVFHSVDSLVGRIADKTLGQLEREGVFVFPAHLADADDISDEQMILQSYNDSYRTSNVMGFLGCGEERLVIASRFSLGDEDFFFRYLLERVLDFPNFTNLKTDTNQDDRIFELLLFLLPQLLREAGRKGVFKTYIRNEYNDGHVRGVIDVARHIQNNIPFIGNISYSQREYSFDNFLMELIRHTIEYIKSKPYGNKLLKTAKDEVKLVIDSTPKYHAADRRKVLEENQKRTIRHAYYHEYRDLQRLCILILQNQKHQFGFGNRKVYGILFDGAWLWEEYVNLLIGKFFYHPMNRAGSGGQRLFAGNVGLIYPDFIGRDPDNRVIADAKYKPIDNIGNRDYLQVLAYMLRFDSAKGYYLYPEANDEEDLMLRLNSGSTYEMNVSARDDVSVVKHGLKVPNSVASYQEFTEKMKWSEDWFVHAL